MNLFFVVLSLLTAGFNLSWSSTPTTTAEIPVENKTTIVVISEKSQQEFEHHAANVFQEQFKKCQTGCQIKNITPYTKEGLIKEEDVAAAIETAPQQGNFLFFDWNPRLDDKSKKVQESLAKTVQKGFLIVGIAGVAKEGQMVLPLHRTVLGSVPEIVIIGEMVGRENLFKASHFGPEMLTAVRPPRDSGQDGQGAYFFTSRLAQKWNDRTPGDWIVHFRDTKAKSRKIWPGIDDFFGRK